MKRFYGIIIYGHFIPPIRQVIFGTLRVFFNVIKEFLGVVIVLGIIVPLVSLFKGC